MNKKCQKDASTEGFWNVLKEALLEVTDWIGERTS